MRKKFVQIAAVVLMISLFSIPIAGAEPGQEELIPDADSAVEITQLPQGEQENGTGSETGDSAESGFVDSTEEPAEKDTILRVGLFYGSDALPGANLQNKTGVGYRFGYDDGTGFCELGRTDETKISVVKTQNVYYSTRLPDNWHGYSDLVTSGTVVGCYHLCLPGTYASFEEAQDAANGVVGGFPAWIGGAYQVRMGSYTDKQQAEQAASQSGNADVTVVGTSSHGISVVATGTSRVIFQFDGGVEYPMFIVNPGQNDGEDVITHFRGYAYYGSFRYERIDGGNLTIVNLVELEDYIKGVIPYEMSPSWPVEALKAQAVCARSYAVNCFGSHSSQHFDLCSTVCCQAYKGTSAANDVTDRAVEETAGIYAWYGDEVIQAFYCSSNGGATENVENVWGGRLPYLRGVIDPYEALVTAKIPGYSWTKTYTGKQLQERFKSYGHVCGEITNIWVSEYSDTGNVLSITFSDINGKTVTVSKDKYLRVMMGVKSLRYSITGGELLKYILADGGELNSLGGVWFLDAGGAAVQADDRTGSYYAITADGTQAISSAGTSDGTFTFTGAGNGHNIGMSQWGAYSMAVQGYTYEDILKFYFTGIEIHPYEDV